MKFPQGYGRPDNLTTYCSDTVMQFMSIHTKRNICAKIKQETFPHQTIAL